MLTLCNINNKTLKENEIITQNVIISAYTRINNNNNRQFTKITVLFRASDSAKHVQMHFCFNRSPAAHQTDARQNLLKDTNGISHFEMYATARIPYSQKMHHER